MGLESGLSLSGEISADLEDLLLLTEIELIRCPFDFVIDSATILTDDQPGRLEARLFRIKAHSVPRIFDSCYILTDISLRVDFVRLVAGELDTDVGGFYSFISLLRSSEPVVLVIDVMAEAESFDLQVIRPCDLSYEDMVGRYEAEVHRYEVDSLEKYERVRMVNRQVDLLRLENGGKWLHIKEGQMLESLPVMILRMRQVLRDKMSLAVARYGQGLISA